MSNEKLKILYLMDYLLRESDEDHPVTVKDMIAELGRHGITAERKSIYRDLKLLGPDEGCYGLDIISDGGKYFVGSREFSSEEVRILADMVRYSAFVTEKKSAKLLKKLTGLVNIHEAEKLKYGSAVSNKIRNMNESVFLSIDRICKALEKDRAVSFRYCGYNLKKEKVPRHDGKIYTVSPYTFVFAEATYLLLCYDHEHEEIRPYRVDKMTDITVLKEKRKGKEAFDGFDMNAFNARIFRMFTETPEKVTMRFETGLIDPIIDRFGEDVILVPDGEETFSVSTEVAVSPQFYAWIAGFNGRAEITAPQSVRDGMKDFLKRNIELYE